MRVFPAPLPPPPPKAKFHINLFAIYCKILPLFVSIYIYYIRQARKWHLCIMFSQILCCCSFSWAYFRLLFYRVFLLFMCNLALMIFLREWQRTATKESKIKKNHQLILTNIMWHKFRLGCKPIYVNMYGKLRRQYRYIYIYSTSTQRGMNIFSFLFFLDKMNFLILWVFTIFILTEFFKHTHTFHRPSFADKIRV